ncbi:DNA topoisomerase I [Arboricoccus pini]|uniref:DNA topoisomerase 1 n=1 Tax=Arboricoccus pini TaxID=1963835 RepID=A0A212Q7N6_9PROT|nr:type I DNA topoisomerase [Arboricoccus pini]SNB55385.1 DNA topoisomerase I [Arboricoccus pini]
MDVVVVESPTKAKSIEKYLGPGYRVFASYGHVRDLPEKDEAVQPDADFAMEWEVLDRKKKALDDIQTALKTSDKLILATDPDREGEAISWHLLEVLAKKKAIADKPVERVVFHEITKRAVLEAMANARQLDTDLIDAYLARRALDYLVGFTLSPVLWRKLPGSRSAGRVQSVALRLICERENEIEAFVAREYWTVEALLETSGKDRFTARLTELAGKKLGKFDIGDAKAAEAATSAVRKAELSVRKIERKQVQRTPSPPFSTSTLQQEASRKLGFSASRTMQVAQRLFEGIELGGETVGLITYMRTDSVNLSSEAIGGARRVIAARFGEQYLPASPRVYKTKAKNAQEAHEAIRPTDPARVPADVASYLAADEKRLYELIWQRTMACQMAAAVLDRVVVEIGDSGQQIGLRATGQTIAFDGFLKLYQEGRDDRQADEEEDDDRLLPNIKEGEGLGQSDVKPRQHFTEPPPRFTEASLVRRLEELGIGRPSTYASIISVLQDRQYVKLEQRRFVPEDRGRLVTAFLLSFFDRYIEPSFTAGLENKLDDVAAGELSWKDVLREFWAPFKGRIDEVMERRVAEVIENLNEKLGSFLFPERENGANPRGCPNCGTGTLSLKLGKFGAFVGCSNYPECRYTRQLGVTTLEGGATERLLGVDPGTSEEVWLKAGRFGPYLQRGTGEEPRRSSLPPGYEPATIDFATAMQILALPREIGTDPNSGEPVEAILNRYGAFVQSGAQRRKLDADDDVLTVGLNRALALLAENPGKGAAPRRAAGPTKGRDLGADPDTGKAVKLLDGRFGPYVTANGVNATLKKDMDPATLTLEAAVELLRAKAARSGKPVRGRGKAAAKPALKTKAATATSALKPKGATATKKASKDKPASKAPARRKG